METQNHLPIEEAVTDSILAFHKELRSKGTTPRVMKRFRDIIYDHYHASAREFPWRETTDPYAILVSEIMLQQTQTERVIPKYLDFLEAFPDFEGLSSASLKEVLEKWQGLGYNRRGKALWDMAQMVVERYHGNLPDSYEDLLTFPGIGPYTAGAVCAFAFNQSVVFMDTNIRRVFIHFFFPNREKVKDSEIVPLVEKSLDREDPAKWYSALMDYGAILKNAGTGRAGEGERNPNRRSAHYSKQSKFEGSDRQIRGAILRELLDEEGLEGSELMERLKENVESIGSHDHKDEERVRYILDQLEREGFVREKKGRWRVLDD